MTSYDEDNTAQFKVFSKNIAFLYRLAYDIVISYGNTDIKTPTNKKTCICSVQLTKTTYYYKNE